MKFKHKLKTTLSVLTSDLQEMIFNSRRNINNYPEINAHNIIKYEKDMILSMSYIYQENDFDEFYEDIIKILNDPEEKIIRRIPFLHYLKPLYDSYRNGKYYIKETKIIINGYNEIFNNIKTINEERNITLYSGFDDKEYKYNIDKNIFYSEYPDGDEHIELENLLYCWNFFDYRNVLFI